MVISYFNQKQLLRLCFYLSFVGLVFLFIFSFFFLPVSSSVISISSSPDSFSDKRVSVSGRISNVFFKDNFVIFYISDLDSIKCVFFNPSSFQKNLIRNNFFVSVSGKFTKYNNEYEIVVESISLLSDYYV